MTTPNWREVLADDLKRHEGTRLKSYKDSLGFWTIGTGHHSKSVKPGMVITQHQADVLLEDDIRRAIDDARIVCTSFDSLDGPRKTVVANMSFNLGRTKLAQFKRTIAAIDAGDYKNAALYMLESKWATQVGQRAKFLAARMASGKY